MTDYYKILGLTSGATLDEIKTAYRKLSKKFHPDLNQGDKFFEERFKEIQEAYEKLTNFEFKSTYDRQKQNQENNYKTESQQYTKADNTNNSQPKSSENSSQPQSKPQPRTKSNNNLFIKIAVGLVIAILIGVLRGSIKKSALENAKESYHNELNNSNSSSAFTTTDTTTVSAISTTNQDLNNPILFDTASITTTSNFDNSQQNSSYFFGNSSKEEIKNWLVKTLQENSQNKISCPERIGGMYSPCTHYNDYEFKITDDYLIVNYNYNDEYDETVYIPFYDYKSLYGTDYGTDFSISTNSNSMYEVNKSTNAKSTSAYINIGFKNSAEPKLITKIENALSTLKNLSSKPSTTPLPTFITNSDKNKPSLEETRNWFISKLKAYTSTDFKIKFSETSYIQAKNVSVNIDNFNLIIQCYSNQYNYKFIVPLCNANIKKPFDQYYNVDNINVCTLEFYTPIKAIEQYDDYSGKSFIKSVQLKVDLERENDLLQRLTKSLNILKSYCPQNSNNKETF